MQASQLGWLRVKHDENYVAQILDLKGGVHKWKNDGELVGIAVSRACLLAFACLSQSVSSLVPYRQVIIYSEIEVSTWMKTRLECRPPVKLTRVRPTTFQNCERGQVVNHLRDQCNWLTLSREHNKSIANEFRGFRQLQLSNVTLIKHLICGPDNSLKNSDLRSQEEILSLVSSKMFSRLCKNSSVYQLHSGLSRG